MQLSSTVQLALCRLVFEGSRHRYVVTCNAKCEEIHTEPRRNIKITGHDSIQVGCFWAILMAFAKLYSIASIQELISFLFLRLHQR